MGRVRRPSRLLGAGASCFVVCLVVSVSLATRGQTDMRGLVTAGRGFGRSGTACLASSVARTDGVGAGLLIGVSRVAPRAATTKMVDEADLGCGLLEDG